MIQISIHYLDVGRDKRGERAVPGYPHDGGCLPPRGVSATVQQSVGGLKRTIFAGIFALSG
jgi:hypothetical protein